MWYANSYIIWYKTKRDALRRTIPALIPSARTGPIEDSHLAGSLSSKSRDALETCGLDVAAHPESRKTYVSLPQKVRAFKSRTLEESLTPELPHTERSTQRGHSVALVLHPDRVAWRSGTPVRS